MKRLLFLICGLCGALTCAAKAAADLSANCLQYPDLQRDLAHFNSGDFNLQIKFYDLQAATLDGLREEVRRKGPFDLSGIKREGLTEWSITWAWPLDTDGSPRFRETKSRADVVVTLPCARSFDLFKPELKRKWQRYQHAMYAHEFRHVQIADAHYKEVAREISSKADLTATKQANIVATRIVARIRKMDADYDRQTEHGRREGVKLE